MDEVDEFASLLKSVVEISPPPSTLPLKLQLVTEIKRLLYEQGLSQTRAASHLDMSQADLSKLLGGKLRSCSLERILRILTQLGQTITIQSYAALPNEPAEIRYRSAPPWGRTVRPST